MKLFNLFVIMLLGTSVMIMTSCGGSSYSSAKISSSAEDSLSYSIGTSIGGNFVQQELQELNIDLVARGIADALDSNKTSLIEAKEAEQFIQSYFQKKQAEKDKELSKVNDAFVAKYGAMPNLTKTATGLMYEVIQEGTGAKPTRDDQVSVHYTGTFEDGNKFDSSFDRGEPTTFGVGQVIPGWTEGLMLMSKGAKYKFYIPQDLAYGPRGSRSIPPYTPLIFEVELIDIIPSTGK